MTMQLRDNRMLYTLYTHWRVWKFTAFNALQSTFVNRWSNLIFFIGKSIRFGMMVLFLLVIKYQVPSFGEYSTDQLIIFFLTYQLLDTITQVVFRGVYMFAPLIQNGEFDFYLAKPINPLFRALTGRPDINDAVFLIPMLAVSGWLASQLSITYTWWGVMWYLLLLINSFLIATGLHILVLAAGILTVEVDGIVWLYRDFMRLGQFPVTIYHQLLRLVLFVLVPVGLMITIPAQILTGSAPSVHLGITLLAGISFFITCLQVWKIAIKHYSSVSS